MVKISVESKFFRKGMYSSLLLAAVIIPTTVAGNNVHATGYVSSPPSRAYYGHTLAPSQTHEKWESVHKIYGNAMIDFHNMMSSKTFDQLPDGNIASADNAHPDNLPGEPVFSLIDKQSSDAWVKQKMHYGANKITWTNPQEQTTKSWQYFMTKSDWNPDQPLSKKEFIPLKDEKGATVIDGGDRLSGEVVTHTINIPQDAKAGYNVIVAVWNLSRQQNSYYQAIDINLQDQMPPSIPRNVQAKGVSFTKATLTWDASKDEHTPQNKITYSIYKEGQTKPIATVKNTSYTLTGLTPDTTTKYSVTATDEAGNESEHSALVAVKAPKDTEAPAKPVLKLDWAGITTLDVSWAKVNDNLGVTQYKIYKDNRLVTTLDATKTNYQLTGLSPQTYYKLKVAALDKAGNINTSDEINARTLPDTVPPSQINNFHAENVTKNAITLKWNAATDNVAVTGYNLYRDGKKIKVLSPNQTNYKDTDLTPDTSYTYAIEATDAANNLSEKVSFTQKTSIPIVKMNLNLDLTNPGEASSGHNIFEFYTTNGYLSLHVGEAKEEIAKFFWYTRGDSTDYDYDNYTYSQEITYEAMKKIKSTKTLYIWGGIKEADSMNGDDNVMYPGYHRLNVSVNTDGTKVTATGKFTGDRGDGSATFTITFREQ